MFCLNKVFFLLISMLLLGCSGIRQTIFVPSEIESYCRRISEDTRAMKTCIAQERSARDRLSGMTVPSGIMRYCRELSASTGGSYQVVFTCIQQEMFDQQLPDPPESIEYGP